MGFLDSSNLRPTNSTAAAYLSSSSHHSRPTSIWTHSEADEDDSCFHNGVLSPQYIYDQRHKLQIMEPPNNSHSLASPPRSAPGQKAFEGYSAPATIPLQARAVDDSDNVSVLRRQVSEAKEYSERIRQSMKQETDRLRRQLSDLEEQNSSFRSKPKGGEPRRRWMLGWFLVLLSSSGPLTF